MFGLELVLSKALKFHVLDQGTNAHSFIKVRGSITVPSTSCNTGLDMAIFEINKNFSLEAGLASFLGG